MQGTKTVINRSSTFFSLLFYVFVSFLFTSFTFCSHFIMHQLMMLDTFNNWHVMTNWYFRTFFPRSFIIRPLLALAHTVSSFFSLHLLFSFFVLSSFIVLCANTAIYQLAVFFTFELGMSLPDRKRFQRPKKVKKNENLKSKKWNFLSKWQKANTFSRIQSETSYNKCWANDGKMVKLLLRGNKCDNAKLKERKEKKQKQTNETNPHEGYRSLSSHTRRDKKATTHRMVYC